MKLLFGKEHLNVRVTDPNVELHFPTVGEPQAWTGYNTNPIHSDFWSLLKEPLPLTSKVHWNNVCPLCIQTGIWEHSTSFDGYRDPLSIKMKDIGMSRVCEKESMDVGHSKDK